MANKDIVGGLFGMTPQSYQQAQNANEMDIAASFAKMKPEEQISFGAFRAGQQLGKAGMSLLGVQDPQLEALTNIQGILGQYDSTTSAGLKQMYGALMQKAQETNNPAYARMAQETATKYQSTLLNEANVTAKTREQLPAIAKLQSYRETLVKQFGENDPRVKEVDAAITAAGKGTGTVVNIDQKGQTAFEQGLGAKDADRVTNAEKLIESAAGTLGTLKKMAEVNQMGVIGGTGSAARIEALKFLDTAGFTTPTEKTRLASSENFNKLTGDLILERIKQLGTNPSNADRDFIAKIVPQLESSALARKQLIEYMADKANQVVNEATKLSTYGRENRGLKGYKPTIPLVDATLPTKNISQYSVQELENMLKNAKPAGAK
jgi:hypothetical protein